MFRIAKIFSFNESLVDHIENAAEKVREINDKEEQHQKMVQNSQKSDRMYLGVDITRNGLHDNDFESVD